MGTVASLVFETSVSHFMKGSCCFAYGLWPENPQNSVFTPAPIAVMYSMSSMASMPSPFGLSPLSATWFGLLSMPHVKVWFVHRYL